MIPKLVSVRMIIGSEIAANIDPRDTYPVVTITIIATIKHRGNAIGNKASNTPINGPIPFPPLNPINIG